MKLVKGQRSSIHWQEIHPRSRVRYPEIPTVYIDTTGTTYTQVQRGHRFEFFLLSLFRNNPHAYLDCPSLLYRVFAYREAKPGVSMTETAPCPLVGEIREPCMCSVGLERHNIIQSRHSRIEASLFVHKV